MTLSDRPIKLEPLAPPYREVWEQDRQHPEFYHYEGQALTRDALRRREGASPGLTIIRLASPVSRLQ